MKDVKEQVNKTIIAIKQFEPYVELVFSIVARLHTTHLSHNALSEPLARSYDVRHGCYFVIPKVLIIARKTCNLIIIISLSLFSFPLHPLVTCL